MKGDALFFLGIIAFFFILWYASGGPTKPISFAGPYISPITDVDTVQIGYGEDGSAGNGFGSTGSGNIWTDLMGIENRVATLQRSSSEIRLFGEASPYRGQVTVSGAGGASATDPDQEYVTIRASGTEPVTISGWKVISGASGRGETIPQGARLPRRSQVNDLAPIVLQPGEEAVIVTGDSPIGDSFKENMCVGYLAQRQSIVPSIQMSCPAASDEFERYYAGNKLKDDACYSLIQSTPSCKTPSDSGRLSSACTALIDNHLDYNGCVDTHQ